MANTYKKVADGKNCEIWFSKKTEKVFKNAPPEDKARVGKFFEHVVENGTSDLTDTQFKSERRLPNGGKHGKKVMVYAFKAFQLRIYGFWEGENPKKFMCVEAAIKKTDKADIEQLKRVAKAAGD